MPIINYKINEPFSSKQMYDLVNDVDSYPLFVPDCINAGVIERSETAMKAFIEVEKLGFKKRFITLNNLTDASRIEMQLVDGPFTELQGTWLFTPITETSSAIEFSLKFTFSNKFMEIAFGKIFEDVMSNMVNAFSSRAKKVYGQ